MGGLRALNKSSMNKKELRIIFMGTPEFATGTLSKLVEKGYQVVGVVTAPDKPAGRGRKLQKSHVKQFAEVNGIPVLQPVNLKDSNFLAQLKALNANLQVVVAFRMLPEAVWAMPDLGTFNLHASLLPDYRGAAPINWAIMNGETKTGVTTFFIDHKIDTGEIILQKETDITEKDTAGTLHDRLMNLGADLVVETLELFQKDAVVTLKQKDAPQVKRAPKLYRTTCEIDWQLSLDTIYNFIRGLSPYPVAWTTLVNGDEKLLMKIYSASKEKNEHVLKPGTIMAGKRDLKIAVEGGFLKLREVQLPGKRRIEVKDLLNGFDIKKNAFVT